ncbi:amidohydrolase family protein, partial [Candidatus Bathyarchaeota archaeon]|nr:amidohydrolase family protein [Candidatus Bathyarchaeota archaeon]
MFDVILRGGRVVDGTGNPWVLGDVAVKDGRIADVGRVEGDAETVIRLEGETVAPGFIDTHSHSDLFLVSEPHAEAKIMQGVTTEIVGQDGLGEAPIREADVAEWRRYLSGLNGDPDIEWTWRTMGEYLSALEKARPSINVASLVGHGNLRLAAVGMDDRRPDAEELTEMKRLLAESLRDGAVGLSTGLIYAPCVYSDTA